MYYIYKLFFEKTQDFYIGMTTDLERRKKEHYQSVYRKEKLNTKIYKFIRENNLRDDLQFIILKKLTDCKERKEAKKEERFFIDLLKPTLNVCLPGRTSLEYFFANKKKIYEKRNKANLSSREEAKKRSLDYYYKNKKIRNQKSIEYYLNNKDKIAEVNKNKKQCLCGKKISHGAFHAHLESKHHKINCKINIVKSKNKLKCGYNIINIRNV